MITLLTAVPGSGKSLHAMEWIDEALKAGRLVFTDIEGCCLPGVLPVPDDWRDTPEGSFVVYDEAQRKYPSTGKPGVAEDERIRALETHRHTGHDIVFITQEPCLIHHHIRKLVGRHVHLHRAANLPRATRYEWDFAVTMPNDRKEQQRADVSNWMFPTRLYPFYKSSSKHTHKFRMPKKIALFGGVLLCVVALVVYRLIAGGGLEVMSLPEAHAADETPARGSAQRPAASAVVGGWTTSPTVPPVVGCVGSETTCRCFGADGLLLELDFATCKNVLEGPLPVNVLKFDQSGGGVGGGTPPTASPLTEMTGAGE